MQVSQVIDQTRRHIHKADMFMVRVNLKIRGGAYLQEVLDASQQHLEKAKQLMARVKLQQLKTLKEQRSDLDGLTLYEKPDVDAMDKLLSSDLLEMVNYQGIEYENEKHHLEAYRSLVDERGTVEVLYKKVKQMNIGRSYCNGSLGAIGLRREIRGTIFSKNYKDIDIVNCHPNIYYQLAKMLKLKTPALKKYVQNRDEVLKTVMDHYAVDRDTAKQLFIRLLYLGSFNGWKKDNNIDKDPLDMINQIQHDMFVIGDKIINNNTDLFQTLRCIRRITTSTRTNTKLRFLPLATMSKK